MAIEPLIRIKPMARRLVNGEEVIPPLFRGVLE